jgi:hypothetical protein
VALFQRKSKTDPVVVSVIDDDPTHKGAKTAKKGRPTPKRSDSQAARRTPIVQTTSSNPSQPLTKEQKAANRAKERAARDDAYVGMKAGVEKHLPARDKGPQRRYIRQYVDARINFGEFFMPLALIFMIFSFILLQLEMTVLAAAITISLYVVVIGAVIDIAIMWFKLKRQLVAKFGDVEKGALMYAGMRALQMRRMRIPAPAFPKRGVYPN